MATCNQRSLPPFMNYSFFWEHVIVKNCISSMSPPQTLSLTNASIWNYSCCKWLGSRSVEYHFEANMVKKFVCFLCPPVCSLIFKLMTMLRANWKFCREGVKAWVNLHSWVTAKSIGYPHSCHQSEAPILLFIWMQKQMSTVIIHKYWANIDLIKMPCNTLKWRPIKWLIIHIISWCLY